MSNKVRPSAGGPKSRVCPRRLLVWRRRDDDDTGAVLIEFALVLPIFAVMLFGMIQFGLVFYGWTSLRNAAQAGVGVAATGGLGQDCTAANPAQPTVPTSCGCPQGAQAVAAGGVNLGTVDLICSVSDQIGQPAGTTGSPRIDLLVQSDVVTVCTQIDAQPFTGFFPAMTLSSTGSVYVENPLVASLTATVVRTFPFAIDGTNDTLNYEINGTQASLTIPHGMYQNAEGLATAIASASTNPPTQANMSLQAEGNDGTNMIVLQPSPPDVAEVVFQLSPTPTPGPGNAVTSGTLQFSTSSDDNDFVESYNPDSLDNCAGLTVSAPSTASTTGPPIDPSALLPGSNANATGTITFSVFETQGGPPSSCSMGGTVLTPVTKVSGESNTTSYASTSTFSPITTGNYWWYASYSGDSEDDASTTVCGKSMAETVVSQ